MEKANITWRVFSIYLLVITLMLFGGMAFGQIEVKQFNAGWNKANDIPWVMDLEDCKTIGYTDISKDKEAQKKYIEKINNKENPVDLKNPFTGYC